MVVKCTDVNLAAKLIQLSHYKDVFSLEPDFEVYKAEQVSNRFGLSHVQRNLLFIRAQYKSSYRKCHI